MGSKVLVSPHEYLPTLDRDAVHVLYYPGSGTDCSPLKLFGEYSNLKTVIYADYGMSRDQILTMIAGLEDWTPAGIIDLQPDDFGETDWENFWPVKLRNDGNYRQGIENAFAIKATLTHVNRHSIEFVFLATEAIQSFTIIHEKYHPDVLVIQDHGFGNDWDSFGNNGKLCRIAIEQNRMPALLYVARNTELWDGYVQVSEYEFYPGQDGTHRRAIYALTELGRNRYGEIADLRKGRKQLLLDDEDEML